MPGDGPGDVHRHLVTAVSPSRSARSARFRGRGVSRVRARPTAENPHRVGKPLRAPMAGLSSARRGEYRVVYEIHEERVHVVVVAIKHRRDAYRVR